VGVRARIYRIAQELSIVTARADDSGGWQTSTLFACVASRMGARFPPSLAEGRPQGASGREICVLPPYAKGSTMPHFRRNMLDERGKVLSEEDIDVETLDAAIRGASNVLLASDQSSSSSRRACSFEVWSGTSRLFPEQPGPKVTPAI
jgi:hypothetical protein